MDTENIEIVNASQGTAEATAEPSAMASDDNAITINALKEVIAENKAAMDALKAELTETKKVNAKLLARMDVGSNQPSTDDVLDNLFNKYNKRR